MMVYWGNWLEDKFIQGDYRHDSHTVLSSMIVDNIILLVRPNRYSHPGKLLM